MIEHLIECQVHLPFQNAVVQGANRLQIYVYAIGGHALERRYRVDTKYQF